jgi:hypothetical protein
MEPKFVIRKMKTGLILMTCIVEFDIKTYTPVCKNVIL